MYENLKTGDLSVIRAALTAAQKLSLNDREEITVSSDTSEIDTLRAKMNEERDRAFSGERDTILHRFQSKEYTLGAWHYMVGKNIYGWSVGESLRSNMGGGRWAQTERGLTLAQAIEWGCERARCKNVRFSFFLSELPEELHEEVKALIASKA